MKKLIASLALLSASYSFAGATAIPGEFVVKLKPEVANQKISNLNKLLNTSVVNKISKQSNTILVKESLVKTNESVIKSLQDSGLVEYVEPNYIYSINQIPNDPDFNKLWGLRNQGQEDPKGQLGVADVDIDAEKAWDITTGSRDVIVAVIDTGVAYNAADLKENIWVNEGEIPNNGIDDDKNGYVDDVHGWDFANNDNDPLDDHGHGSHCSGTIGAKGNDGIGVAGVAWNVRIMGLKFLSASGSGSLSGAIGAIDYATSMGAHIQSNSWGGGGRSQALLEAIERANSADSLFVAAAGNSSLNNDVSESYPANYEVENVISVAAANNQAKLAYFSNYGKEKVHIAAPGVNIYSTTNTGYDAWSGTSMATPHVSGVAVLLKSEFPDMTAVQIKERLLNTARPFAGFRSKVATSGMLNAYHALTNTQPPADPNDPFEWESVVESYSTEHPYASKLDEEIRFTVPGASKVSVHFSEFDTENNFDKVEFLDADGKSYGVISGKLGENFGPVVPGDTIILRFTTDVSVTRYGFDIDAIHYQ